MNKIECLQSTTITLPSTFAAQKISRKEFWAAFGEEAPPKKTKEQKAQKKRRKFLKRFWSKIPDACAKVAVRGVLAVAVISILVVCGFNPVRFFVQKFI